jgi:hypothetical protein
MRIRQKILASPVDEASLWEALAEALGYQLISIGRYPGSSGWASSMLRPDGSTAEFAMEERELRAVVAALGTGGPKKRILRRTNNPASGIVGERVGDAPASEVDHFYRCPHCGQAVDKRDLGQVFHHEQPGHERLTES